MLPELRERQNQKDKLWASTFNIIDQGLKIPLFLSTALQQRNLKQYRKYSWLMQNIINICQWTMTLDNH